jgi:hypothetical protein
VSAVIARLVGVYDADGSVLGELSYFVRARFGAAHCALCDITHGRVRERRDWRDARARLPVPVDLFHRDDQPEAVREAGGASPPVVVAETTDDRLVLLLERADLERCAGSPPLLVEAIETAVATCGLDWPSGFGPTKV